ncbi:electron transport complex subunit RsxC [Enterococcus hailinensis]|uniref:electron transport complex subunit RsxC n=1 Tax=Enterococcus hailinensis TaxID=3238988 RepID=UPI0038B2FFDB
MKIHDFSGGFFFEPSTKQLKKLFAVENENVFTFTPKTVTIPFDQHIGAPNELVVSIGETVKQGQIIAKSSADISGHVHSSVSGIVLEILEVPTFDGETQSAIKIQCTQEATTPELIPEELDPETAVRHAGIVGLGGATFPTHIKLDPDDRIEIETVILNGAECEPFLASDDYLMRYESRKILRGGELARQIIGAKKILIGIESDKPKALAAMKEVAKTIPDCHVLALPVKYPQGGEGQLLETLLAKESPIDGRSVETGGFTINVATAFAIAEAVDERKSLTHRYVTITGDVVEPKVIAFPLGTSVGDLIDYCGGFAGTPSRVIHGGPMMGKTITSLDFPLAKGSNGIIVFNQEHDGKLPESPCIRCNRCVDVCPVRLEPQSIDLAYRNNDLFTCDQLMAEECINCGCCTYVCPARRDLAAKINAAGAEIKAIKKELAANEK